MRISNGKSLQILFVFFSYLILLVMLNNNSLSYYELEEKYTDLSTKFDALNTYVNRFGNISFPISYSLKYYENLFDLPTIYVITPTNSRADTQLADLTRMRNTLWLVPKLFWIVVEDSAVKTRKVEQFMETTQMPSVHLNDLTSEDMVVKSSEKTWAKPRGVQQRNKGLDWLRANAAQLDLNGVVYFADDDNTYDIRLFEEMRFTRKVSVWPVAFVGELLYERPVCREGKVVDWFRIWGDHRPFPMDMAGFAINLSVLLAHPSARFSQFIASGMQESHLLSHLVSVHELEAKADNCTKVYVWHTNTRKVNRYGEKHMTQKGLVYDKTILAQV